MTQVYLIYKHTSPNGKAYIGQTFDYQRRCLEHQRESQCTALWNAIKKYGWNNFTHEVLKDGLTLEEANLWEKFYIKKYKTMKPNGYNIRTGGENSRHSEATKIKISNANSGKKRSPEWIAMIKRVNTGRKHSQEVKNKIAKGNKGKIVSLETRQKIKLAAIEQHKNPDVYKKCSKTHFKPGRKPSQESLDAASKATKLRWKKFRENKICHP